MSAEKASASRQTRGELRPWLAAFVPVVAWIAAQQVGFFLSGKVCASGSRWVLHLVIGIAFLTAAGAGALSWKDWRALSRKHGTPGAVPARRRFMALGGVLLAAISLVSIVALAIPAFVHRPCD